MSRAKALADAEADATEAEDEPTEPSEAEKLTAELVDPDSAPDDGQSIEAALRAFERENERHASELAAIMGEDFAAMVPCDHCNAVGFEARMPLRRDPTLVACEFCEARGYLQTPSLVEGKEVRACSACQGEGFVPKPYEPEQPQGQPYYAPQQPPPGYDPNGQPQAVPPLAPGAPGWAPGYTPPAHPWPSGQ